MTGPTGSGKSALLASILQELVAVDGHTVVEGTTAYAAQTPWLMAATIRENVLLGSKLLPKRYASVRDYSASRQPCA